MRCFLHIPLSLALVLLLSGVAVEAQTQMAPGAHAEDDDLRQMVRELPYRRERRTAPV